MALIDKRITIPEPPNIVNDEYPQETMKTHVVAHLSKLWKVFPLDCGDDGATVDPGNITINEVCWDDTSVTIYYDFEWSSYYGCKDMEGYGVEQDREVVGSRVDGSFVFPEWKPEPPRDTVDEF